MGFKYNPTAYETWRPNYEMRQCLAWFAAFVVYMLWSDYYGVHGLTLGCALICALMGLRRMRAANRRFHMTLRLAGTPMPFIDFTDLKRLINDPTHQDDMWLGRGFAWGQTQTQRVNDLLKRDWHKTYREALGAFYVVSFLREHIWLCLFRPLKAIHTYKEVQKRVSDIQGQTWIHGVGDAEEDIFQPVSHTEGHTLIVGTTGSGKTRCFDLLISQAVLRGETVFIIDPKGDRDLREKAKRACRELGRGTKFVFFHPAFPKDSIRLNMLANWTRPSEIADRVAALIPAQSWSDPFKNFAFGALNAICGGLCMVHKKPTLKNLKHYLAGTGSGTVAELVVKSLNLYLRSAAPQSVRKLDQFLMNLRSKDAESMAAALIEYYSANGPADSDVDDLVSMFCHNREHFGKMITSLLPVLSMLTSGTLGEMLSPGDEPTLDDTHIWRNTGELIENNQVVYVGLDSLSSPLVGSAIGSMLLSDLANVAGSRYNFEAGRPLLKGQKRNKRSSTVTVFVDEAAEVVNPSFLQILNKGRGAGLRLFVATQTIADFEARLGKASALQFLGNMNNRISLRCIDPETQKFIADAFPKTKIVTVQHSQGLSTAAFEPVPKGGNLAERLTEEEVPLFAPQLLSMLPNLEFIASVSGGNVFKGRYPLILKDKSEYKK